MVLFLLLQMTLGTKPLESLMASVLCPLLAGLLLGLIWHRRRRLRARALGKGHTSMKGSSADGTEISQQSDRLAFPFVGPPPGPSPPQSAVSSLNSIPSSSNRVSLHIVLVQI